MVLSTPKGHVHEAEKADLGNEEGGIGFIEVVNVGKNVDKRLTPGD